MSTIQGVVLDNLEELIPPSKEPIQQSSQELVVSSLCQEQISSIALLEASSNSTNNHSGSSLIDRVTPISPFNLDLVSEFVKKLSEDRKTGKEECAKEIIAYFEEHSLLPGPLLFDNDPDFEITVIQKLVDAACKSPLIREFFREFTTLQADSGMQLQVIKNKICKNEFDYPLFCLLLNEDEHHLAQLIVKTKEGYGLEEQSSFVITILHELIHAYHWLVDPHSEDVCNTLDYEGFDTAEEKRTIGVIQNVLEEHFTENRFRLELGLPLRLSHRSILHRTCEHAFAAKQLDLYLCSIETGCLGFPIDYDRAIQNLTLEKRQQILLILARHRQKGSEEQQACAQVLLPKQIENLCIENLWKLLKWATERSDDQNFMRPIFHILLFQIITKSKNNTEIDNNSTILSYYNHSVANAIKNNFINIIPLLLNIGGDISEEHASEALIDATTKGNSTIVEMLLAKQTIPPTTIQAAIRTAAFKGHIEIIELLLSNGRLPKKELQSALYAAIVASSEGGQAETLRILLGKTPISTSCRTKAIIAATRDCRDTPNVDVIKILLDNGEVSLNGTLDVLKILHDLNFLV